MNENTTNITADAIAIQEKDAFRAQGWLKLVAPAKVNLNLSIGPRREDGYHDAVTVMHALNLHDTVYARRALPDVSDGAPIVHMVSCGDVLAPQLPSEENIASKAVYALANEIGANDIAVEIRIEKNIPSEGGLGGGSSDAAAALLAAAHLWGLDEGHPAIEAAARKIGADVAFFLRGGCALHRGTGDEFVRALEASKRSVALVKPDGGVSTGEAYRVFDANPLPIPLDIMQNAEQASSADEILLFNNLAAASESIMPELAQIRKWLKDQPGVEDALLCGSGATTFAICSDFASACAVVASARKQGHWARATSFGSARAMMISQGDA